LEYERNGRKGSYELAELFARAGAVCALDAAAAQHTSAFVGARGAVPGFPLPTAKASSSRPRRALTTSQTQLAVPLTETPLAMQNPKRLKTVGFAKDLEDAIFAGLGDDHRGDGAAKSPLDESLVELLRDDEDAAQRAANNASTEGGAIDACEPDQATSAARM
jgi:hypothetical protein